MLIDPQTGRKTRQNGSPHQLYGYLMLDSGGTGLFHASFCPEHLGEHEHRPHQVTVLLDEAFVTTAWRSGSGRSYQQAARGGQCYVVPSQQPHGLVIERASELISFYLNPSFIAEVLPEVNQGQTLELRNLHICEDPLIQQLAIAMRIDRLLHGAVNKLLVESAINVLVIHLVNQYATVSVKLSHSGRLSNLHLVQVKEFIESESINDITIADMAKITGYSAVHFSRMFKQSTGQSPYRYLTNYRITHAKTLLQTTRLTIAEVAHHVGFGSHAHFSTQFRRQVGVSPQEYRTRAAP